MSRIKDVEGRVMWLLRNFPDTRNSDKDLVLAYVDNFVCDSGEPFRRVLKHRDMPSLETIRRTRQKIQQEYPELRAADKIERERIGRQIDFIEYALDGR